ncbi:hypothetical protein Q1695_003148 [Nippostrongylus brasiliensis]|nr:hypothetical protein Q1695_003148 [Nippostrongylus brasiliensis]
MILRASWEQFWFAEYVRDGKSLAFLCEARWQCRSAPESIHCRTTAMHRCAVFCGKQTIFLFVLMTTIVVKPSNTQEEKDKSNAENGKTDDSDQVGNSHSDSVERRDRQAIECYNDEDMTSDDRRMFLKLHNDVRRNLAKGQQKLLDEYLPTASNMYKLKWSCLLEDEVARRISTCQSSPPKLDGFGLNVAALTLFHHTKTMTEAEILDAFEEWWTVTLSNYENLAKSDPQFQIRLQRIANIISGRTTQIGCAWTHCDDVMYIGCMYHKNATSADWSAYDRGPYCLTNSDCITYKPSKCYDGLCVRGDFSR